MLIQQTVQHLQQLRLMGMANAFREQQTQPALHALSFEERLGLLVDHELQTRTGFMIAMRVVVFAHLIETERKVVIRPNPFSAINRARLECGENFATRQGHWRHAQFL